MQWHARGPEGSAAADIAWSLGWGGASVIDGRWVVGYA
jgi:hypothetical protein